MIWYDLEDSKYKIKDLSIGFGVFVRLNFPLKLRDNSLLHMGESFAVVNMIAGEEAEDNSNEFSQKLRIKVFGGPSSGDVFFFKGIQNKSIKLGR